MAAAKRKPKTTPTKSPPKPVAKAAMKAAAKTAATPAAKLDTPTLNGIPLRRKSVWAIDTDSAQFRAARKRDALALTQAGEDGSMQILDALLNDKDVQKWWN
jgi:hypothetical protein